MEENKTTVNPDLIRHILEDTIKKVLMEYKLTELDPNKKYILLVNQDKFDRDELVFMIQKMSQVFEEHDINNVIIGLKEELDLKENN